MQNLKMANGFFFSPSTSFISWNKGLQFNFFCVPIYFICLAGKLTLSLSNVNNLTQDIITLCNFTLILNLLEVAVFSFLKLWESKIYIAYIL